MQVKRRLSGVRHSGNRGQTTFFAYASIVAVLSDVHGHTADHFACAARHERDSQGVVNGTAIP